MSEGSSVNGTGPAEGRIARRPARIGWIVDAQVDFMDPAGRLYIRDLFDDTDPGSVQVVPALVKATAWMRAHCDVIVYTGRLARPRGRRDRSGRPGSGRGDLPPALHGALAVPGGSARERR